MQKKERQQIINQIAFNRAEFEIQHQGQQFAAFARPEVFAEAKFMVGPEKANEICTTRFVNECIARVPSMRRMIEAAA